MIRKAREIIVIRKARSSQEKPVLGLDLQVDELILTVL